TRRRQGIGGTWSHPGSERTPFKHLGPAVCNDREGGFRNPAPSRGYLAHAGAHGRAVLHQAGEERLGLGVAVVEEADVIEIFQRVPHALGGAGAVVEREEGGETVVARDDLLT